MADAAALDVRDMLCAQALAQVDAALHRLAPGSALVVTANAGDVVRDLAAWGHDRGHTVLATPRGGETDVMIRKGR